jgi:hypothetical protein
VDSSSGTQSKIIGCPNAAVAEQGACLPAHEKCLNVSFKRYFVGSNWTNAELLVRVARPQTRGYSQPSNSVILPNPLQIILSVSHFAALHTHKDHLDKYHRLMVDVPLRHPHSKLPHQLEDTFSSNFNALQLEDESSRKAVEGWALGPCFAQVSSLLELVDTKVHQTNNIRNSIRLNAPRCSLYAFATGILCACAHRILRRFSHRDCRQSNCLARLPRQQSQTQFPA